MGDFKYANSIEVQLQAFDAQLKFGFGTPAGLQEETTIIISPQHLKVLTQMLDGAVEQYEKQFGVINVPTAAKIEQRIEEKH